MFEKARQFLTESAQELRKSTWPARKEVIASTAVVLFVSVFFMLVIALVDWLVIKGLDLFLK